MTPHRTSALRTILPIVLVATSLMCLAGCDSRSELGSAGRQIVQPVRLSYVTYSNGWGEVKNAGDDDVAIKWVLINNRDECLAVPVTEKYSGDPFFVILDADSTAEILDSVTLKVGQGVSVRERCNETMKVRIGFEGGDVEIDLAGG